MAARASPFAALVLLALVMAGCQAAAPTPVNVTDPALKAQIELALQDAARRSGVANAQLRVLDAEFVTWADGAAGCPEPGMSYTQALVPGVRIRIQAGPQLLNYHGARRGGVAFCPVGRVAPAAAGSDAKI